ncbi:MAG: hypothetical protein D6729_08830 [Deltaproteobacteria bacterium]|nr:MAG: hypothetical protein D6729_08830 [Deltaproteobacteria bacterium]
MSGAKSVRHLDEARYQALLEGRLPPGEARALAEHFEGPCERCETFLAARLDGLDGLADGALLAVAEPAAAGPGEAPPAPAPVSRRRARRGLRLAAAAGVLAAAAVLLVSIVPEIGPEVRHKGERPDPAVAVELEVLRVDGGQPAPVAGAPLPQGATVVFRLRLDAPACVQLWESGRPLLDTPRCLSPGAHILSEGDHPLGLTLDAPGRVELRAAPAQLGPGVAAPVVLEVVDSTR